MELIFKTEKVSDRITRIFAFNTELMYLVEGENAAALIDTGSGFGSLKGCVDVLTDKPLTVLCTHGHTDHALGCGEFDNVYINPLEREAYTVHSDMAFRAGSGEMWPEFALLRDDQIIKPMPFEEMKALSDGDTFDLGGISLVALDAPGHTAGSMAILIPEERTLLLGDACNNLVFLFDNLSLKVSEYKKSLCTLLEKVRGKYDTVLLSHRSGIGTPNVIESVIDVCDDILEGRSDEVPFIFKGVKAMMAKAVDSDNKRLDGGFGNIVYSDITLG